MNTKGYKTIKVLGEGGNSIAYLAKDMKSGRRVTVKQLKQTDSGSFDLAKKSMQNEADILRSLDHPGIPKLIEAGEDYIVLQHFPGISAEKRILKKGLFTEKEAVDTALFLIDILGYLHSGKVPVIYRDLKPSNVIIGPKGQISLIDFGTARVYKKSEKRDTTNLGTMGYAAPEQYGNLGQTDTRTDIYCLGMTMLQLLSGVDPRDEEAVARFKSHGVKGVSPELLRIIDKCTRPDREDRFENVTEVAKALETYPTRKRLRTIGRIIKMSVASAAAAFVIASATMMAGEVREETIIQIEEKFPAFMERMNNVKARIDGFITAEFGENG